MIVCLCKGVSSGTVRDVVADGASTVEEVGMACMAGTDCGGCHGCIEEIIEETEEALEAVGSGRRMLPVVRAA